PADGRQRHAGASVARRRLDRHRGGLLRLLALRTTCAGALRGAQFLGPVQVDGLGLGQALLGGMVGNRGRRSLPVHPGGVTDHPQRRPANYREGYGAASPNVGLKMTAEAVAEGIVERERSDAALRYGVLDPACFKEDGGPSIAERVNKVLIQARLRPFHAA